MTVRADALSVYRGGRCLLNFASVSLVPGQVTTVVGPNGAGKSTMLGCLAGSIQPDYGMVLIDDVPMSSIPSIELARRRAVLLQSYHAPLSLTAEELVSFGRMPHRNTPGARDDQRIISAAMDEAGVGHLVGRTCATLSGGELQRVHMARAMAQVWPANSRGELFFFLDEPTASLDPAYQLRVLRLMRQLADQGYGVFTILHDLNHALMVADKVVLLSQGNIVDVGLPEQVLSPQQISEIYGIDAVKIRHPETGRAVILFSGHQHVPSGKATEVNAHV